MRNLVRGGIILVTLTLFAVYIYAQTRPAKDLIIANDSQIKTEDNLDKADNSKNQEANTKLVKTTGLVSARGASRGSFVATAYCLKGRTATGSGVRRGLIAADPRVLRL